MSVNLNKLDGRIITFESVRFPGWFIDSRDKSTDEVALAMLPPSKRVDPNKPDSDEAAEWPQWIVRVRERDGRVSFESAERKKYYLDLSHWKGHGRFNKVLVTWVDKLHNVGSWGQFRIKGDMNDAMIQSCRWSDRWLCAQKRMKVMGGQGPDRFGEWGHWIIKDVFAGADQKPKAPEEKKKAIKRAEWVDSYKDMCSANGLTFTYKKGRESTHGEDSTYGTTTTVGFSQEYGVEFASDYGGIRTAFGMHHNLSTENSRTKTMTTSTMSQREFTVAPPPGTKGMYTAFSLQVEFVDGDKLFVMTRTVPTDRLRNGMFNPTKLPKMLPNKALLNAIEAAYMLI